MFGVCLDHKFFTMKNPFPYQTIFSQIQRIHFIKSIINFVILHVKFDVVGPANKCKQLRGKISVKQKCTRLPQVSCRRGGRRRGPVHTTLERETAWICVCDTGRSSFPSIGWLHTDFKTKPLFVLFCSQQFLKTNKTESAAGNDLKS